MAPGVSRGAEHVRPAWLVYMRAFPSVPHPSFGSMASQNSYVRQHSGLDKCSPRFLDQLITLLSGKEYRDHISNLSDQDAVWLIEYLDNVRTPIHV